MNWLTGYVRPKIRTLFTREVPDNLWCQCSACQQMIFHRDLATNLRVCTHCGFHMRAKAADRLAWTFDEGKFTRIELPKAPSDPLRFRDQKRYIDRLKESRDKTHLDDALVVAHGTIGGHRTVVAVMEFSFMGGSMGAAVGEGIVAAARLAVLQQAPLIVFTASGGARMQEGTISLMQMPRTVLATRLVKEAGLPYIVVLTDPTTGGVTASFAMLGDLQIAEPGAMIGFAGARVIEQTVREKLPDGFQRAEYLHVHGIVDLVVPRSEMAATLGRIIGLLLNKETVLPVPVTAADPAQAAPPPVAKASAAGPAAVAPATAVPATAVPATAAATATTGAIPAAAAAQAAVSSAAAPSAGAPSAGAPSAGAPSAGAPSAGAPSAGAKPAGAKRAGANPEADPTPAAAAAGGVPIAAAGPVPAAAHTAAPSPAGASPPSADPAPAPAEQPAARPPTDTVPA